MTINGQIKLTYTLQVPVTKKRDLVIFRFFAEVPVLHTATMTNKSTAGTYPAIITTG